MIIGSVFDERDCILLHSDCQNSIEFWPLLSAVGFQEDTLC